MFSLQGYTCRHFCNSCKTRLQFSCNWEDWTFDSRWGVVMSGGVGWCWVLGRVGRLGLEEILVFFLHTRHWCDFECSAMKMANDTCVMELLRTPNVCACTQNISLGQNLPLPIHTAFWKHSRSHSVSCTPHRQSCDPSAGTCTCPPGARNFRRARNENSSGRRSPLCGAGLMRSSTARRVERGFPLQRQPHLVQRTRIAHIRPFSGKCIWQNFSMSM